MSGRQRAWGGARGGAGGGGRGQSDMKGKDKQGPTPNTPVKTDQVKKADSTLSAPESAYDHPNPSGSTTTANDHPALNSDRRIGTDDADPKNSSNPVAPHEGKTKPSDSASGTPLTPPPDPSSGIEGSAGPSASKGPSTTQDLKAVDELLDAMKHTFNVMGTTFDILSQQAVRVAGLGPAIDAERQISIASKHVEDYHKQQEQRMQDIGDKLKKQISSDKLKLKMQEAVSEIVCDIVRREISERVRAQLMEQVTEDIREQVTTYKRKILEVRTSLHNSEARRHNALIRSNSLDEPLKPLLRPVGSSPISPTAPPMSASGADLASASVTPTPTPSTKKGKAPDPATMKPVAPSQKDSQRVAASDSKTTPPVITGARADTDLSSGAKPVLPTIITDLVPPTPSPLFPRDITMLMKLGPNETKTLMQDYGLVPVRDPGTPLSQAGGAASAVVTDESENDLSTQYNINKFLSHIGVGIQVVASPSGRTPTTPFVTMMSH